MTCTQAPASSPRPELIRAIAPTCQVCRATRFARARSCRACRAARAIGRAAELASFSSPRPRSFASRSVGSYTPAATARSTNRRWRAQKRGPWDRYRTCANSCRSVPTIAPTRRHRVRSPSAVQRTETTGGWSVAIQAQRPYARRRRSPGCKMNARDTFSARTIGSSAARRWSRSAACAGGVGGPFNPGWIWPWDASADTAPTRRRRGS
jgi:hypothetical protein